MSVHAGYQYRSATKVANTTASITDQEAYDILDLGVAYTTANDTWRFAVEGKNILDEEYRVAGYDFGATGADGRVQPDRLLRPAADGVGDGDVSVLIPERMFQVLVFRVLMAKHGT